MNRSEDLRPILDELLMLLVESMEYQRVPEVRAVYHEAKEMLLALRRRVLAASKQYVVAVVGLTNVGKSTLLNALFGEELAPRRNGPCTAAPIEFTYGDSLAVTAYHYRSMTRPTWSCPNVEKVHERLSALADDSGAERSRSIQRVVVQAPLPLLKHGLIIADTPGFGAAQTGGAEGSHEDSLRKYLVDSVSQVFWVVLAEQGIGKREKDFHDNMFGQVCDDVIVTGCDDWEPTDCDRFRHRFSQSFHRLPRFHFASGLRGLKARKAGDDAALSEAGIKAIEDRVQELAGIGGRFESIQNSILALAGDLTYWLTEYRTDHETLKVWWRPDSWDRWTGQHRQNEFKQQLTTVLEKNNDK